jgi:MarR family transcriptional regulator, organic hydroperoxide resistance regulator
MRIHTRLTPEVRRLVQTTMAKSNPRIRPSSAAPGGNLSNGGTAPEEETFPPLSTSLAAFVKNGSDLEFRRLIYDLLGLADLMRLNTDHFGRYIGRNNAQFHVMIIIADTPDATVSRIAQLMNVTSQFVTIEIGKLIRDGIVAKRHNETDRRSSFLDLTPKGRNLLRELAPLRRRTNDLHFRSLTEDRAKILKEIIETLIVDGRRALHELESPHVRDVMAPSARSGPETRSDAPRRKQVRRHL